MTSKPSKLAFRSVVDLGLRDIGVRNDPRRFGALAGKALVHVFAAAVILVIVVCMIAGFSAAGPATAMAFALLMVAGTIVFGVRMAKRSPVMVLKVTAEGGNQALWLVVAPFLTTVPLALMTGEPLMIPVIAFMGIIALLLWRGRNRVPEVLRELRPLLAADEAVLGDGVGSVPKERNWREGVRVVVATDRRLLVVTSPHAARGLVVVDAPYERVKRFGVEWKYMGRVAELSLTVARADGAPSETHVVTAIAPANLLSIALALQSHGVHTDDPAAVAEAERAWAETLAETRGEPQRPHEPHRPGEPQQPGEPQHRAEPRKRLVDPAAMNTPEFDRGLWVLLGLAAVAFYVNPFGVGIGASRNADLGIAIAVPAMCGICGYLAGTRSSLAYLVPLNLVVAPAFFFWPASYVIALMVILSAVAALALWTGSALRGVTGGGANGSGEAAGEPVVRAPRGSLRYTLSGVGLLRITGMLLGGLMALVVTASAAGFELTSVRLAIEERTLQQVPVDGRSNLTGGDASVRYTPGPDLREFITDNLAEGQETDGARWELRSSFTKGYNMVSLAHYIREPVLDNPTAIANFVAEKDREHAQLAGYTVTHTERVVAGRKGYVWNHGSRFGYWYYAAWFPQPVHTVRVECIAKRQEQRFRRLCSEAMESLEFRR